MFFHEEWKAKFQNFSCFYYKNANKVKLSETFYIELHLYIKQFEI